MDKAPPSDAERRDAVLRRMLATPKPGKGGKKGAEAESGKAKPEGRSGKPARPSQKDRQPA